VIKTAVGIFHTSSIADVPQITLVSDREVSQVPTHLNSPRSKILFSLGTAFKVGAYTVIIVQYLFLFRRSLGGNHSIAYRFGIFSNFGNDSTTHRQGYS